MKKQKTTVLFEGEGEDARAVGVKIEYPTLRKSITVMLADCTSDLRDYAACHGIKQNLGDAASGKTPKEKYEMALRKQEAMLAGNWDLPTREVDTSAIVIEAMARVKGIEVSAVEQVLSGIDDEEARAEKIAEWRANAHVKAAIVKIRAERAATAAEDSEDDEPELE